jgi:hypothetical protein
MHRTSSFWFGRSREEFSATGRAPPSAKRDTRLEQHMLHARNESIDWAHPGGGRASRVPARMEQRDPHELKMGVDVQELPESAYDRLFTPNDCSDSIDD